MRRTASLSADSKPSANRCYLRISDPSEQREQSAGIVTNGSNNPGSKPHEAQVSERGVIGDRTRARMKLKYVSAGVCGR